MKVKEGDYVAVLWLDSGRDSHSKQTKLATRWTYGRVAECDDDETLCLAMDVCTGQDEHDDSGNRWGFIWRPSIKKIIVLEPKKPRKRKVPKQLAADVASLALNLDKEASELLVKVLEYLV